MGVTLQMVFGWGRKKEEEPGLQEMPAREIPLSDVPRVASELLELRRSQAVSEVRLCRDRAVPLLSEVSYIGRELEKDDLNVEDIDKNIRVIVVRGKKQVIDTIRKEITDLPAISSYDDAVALNGALNQALKKVGDVLGRQTRVIHIFAKKYASKLKEILAEVASINDDVGKILQNFARSDSENAAINGLIGEIAELEGFNAESRQKASSLAGSLAECRGRIAACRESIAGIKSSQGYARLLETKEALERLRAQRASMSGRVADRFTRVSRPLGRYEYASSLDKEQKALLSGLIQSPFEVLTPGNERAIIVILENVKKGVSAGSISVKDREKAILHITELEDALGGIISEIAENASGQESARAAIEELTPPELAVLEKDLAKSTLDESSAESRIRSLGGEVSANEARIPRIVGEIESRLRRFTSTRYSITTED